MNDIIAGDPAPTNPTAAAAAIQILSNAGLSPATAGMLARRIVAATRREVLAEAVEAARSTRLPSVLFGSGIAYNHGNADAVAAIVALTEAGESRA